MFGAQEARTNQAGMLNKSGQGIDHWHGNVLFCSAWEKCGLRAFLTDT